MRAPGSVRRRLVAAALVLGVVGGFGSEFVRMRHRPCAMDGSLGDGAGAHGPGAGGRRGPHDRATAHERR